MGWIEPRVFTPPTSVGIVTENVLHLEKSPKVSQEGASGISRTMKNSPPGLASRTLPWLDRPLHFGSNLVALSDNRRFVIWLMCHIIKNDLWFIKWALISLWNHMKVHLYSSVCTAEQWPYHSAVKSRFPTFSSFICLSSLSSSFSSFSFPLLLLLRLHPLLLFHSLILFFQYLSSATV